MTAAETKTMTANNAAEADREGEQSGENENAPIRHIQTVPVRFNDHVTGEGQFTVGITPSIRAAGLDADGMFRYVPEEVDNLGLVPAYGMEGEEGQVRDNRTYSVYYTGSKEDKALQALRLAVPDDVLEALGIDVDEAKTADNPPLLDVLVGDHLLAFDKSDAISVPADALPDDYEGDTDGEDVVLHQVQTTTPIMRSYGIVTAKLTAAVRQVGGEDATDLGAIKFHPDRAADLDGVVPATLYEEGDGRSEADMYSLQRVSSNSGAGSMRGFEATIPDDVLNALGLSPEDDYEDVPLEERPALTIYAGDHLLAFGRPGEREITVDRGQTPVESAPTLTDLDGIGPALADELATRGFETVADLSDADREDLLAVPQLGDTRADAILDDISRRRDEDGDER